ncbi:S8 family serine peptidase [Streptomyces sp. NPDC051636]|uniref:S8 family serine peptidase n=1 Tax=Streptomyces sp. NPDC051636 TaxID=3365663 RepID=UPI0037B23ED4
MPPAVADPSPTPPPITSLESPRFDAGKAKPHTLTLVTGDVISAAVQPDGRIAASVQASAGAGHLSWTKGKETYFLPKQAAPYVTAGLVDRELFNITRLIKDGYDDRKLTTLPLILSYEKRTARGWRDRPALDGSVKARELRSINATAVRANKKKAADFWRDLTGTAPGALAKRATSPGSLKLADGITKVWLDRKVEACLDVSVPRIGAPEVWKSGYTGKGVTVAVLDTGIAKHPDLEGKVIAEQDFSGSDTGTDDRTGHGTHVAGTIAGTGAASGGKYKGVAPDAAILNGKVLGDDGSGMESWVISGMEWAASKAQVVNLSLGSDQASDGTDPSSEAIDNLTKSTGALFVVAAGNSGPRARTIGSPAAADAALTVGAVSKQDELAGFSSRGPRIGDNAIKPEVTAPGVGIAAPRVKGTPVGDDDPVDDNYARASGTSMATPHVSGTAALLLQQHSDWKADRLKAALTSTAKALPDLTPYQQGAGRVDVARASSHTVSASTGTLNLGYFELTSGEDDVDPVVKTVTYRNTGDQPVILDLKADAADDKGVPAGGDQLKVEPANLTVPAGGTSDATVTLDLAKGPFGIFAGALTASAGDGSPLRTTVAFTKLRAHEVSLKAIDRQGRPASAWVVLASQSSGETFNAWIDGGTGEGTVKVMDEGPFSVSAFVSTKDEPDRYEIEQTAFALPDVKVAQDRELVFDARKAKPIELRLDRRTEHYQQSQNVYRKQGEVNLLVISGTSDTTTRLSAVPSETAAGGEFEYSTHQHRIAPMLPRVRTVGSGVALHPTYMGLIGGFSNAHLDGRRRLEIVDVGAGRPEDYEGKDVSGKIALIAYNPKVPSSDLIATAAERKAKATLIYGDQPGVFHDDSVWLAKIPPLEISHEEGRKLLDLLESGRVQLDIHAVASVPYDYKLMLPEKDRIPDSLTYRYTDDELASFTSKFHAQYPDQAGAYTLLALRPYQLGAFTYFVESKLPQRARHHVIADGENSYGQIGFNQWPYGRYPSVVFPDRYGKPGHQETKEWFKAPLVPGITTVHVPPSRRGNTILLNMSSIIDSNPEHAFAYPANDSETRVYENGELIATRPNPSGEFTVGSGEKATYRVEHDVKEQVDNWQLSTTSHTVWTFDSAGTPEGDWTPLPVVNNIWDLPLDGNNAARAGAPFVLKLKPATQFDAPQVPIKDVRIEVSYDSGKTWQQTPTPVGLPDGSYRAAILHPELADTDGKVALRLYVADAQGGKLEQTVHAAYLLK